MKATIRHEKKEYLVDLSQPMDISIPLRGNSENVTAWYLSPPRITPVEDAGFIGNVARGGAVNFNNILFNPHAHGTHTECVGHITETFYSVNASLQRFFFMAVLITVAPEKLKEDQVITKKQLQDALKDKIAEAVVVRTLPNGEDKLSKAYSHSNWPYFTEDAALFLRDRGVKHLLVDLPSIDKEKDEGKIMAHKAFWNVSGSIRIDATITELIYVPHMIKDGRYLLNLQIAAFENDASPSKPLLYALTDLDNTKV